jgi:hypothetical protein
MSYQKHKNQQSPAGYSTQKPPTITQNQSTWKNRNNSLFILLRRCSLVAYLVRPPNRGSLISQRNSMHFPAAENRKKLEEMRRNVVDRRENSPARQLFRNLFAGSGGGFLLLCVRVVCAENIGFLMLYGKTVV